MTLSIDELVARAEAKTKKRLRSETNASTLRYIREVGWESGTVAIPTYVIFWHYRNVWKADPSAKANKTVFFRTFNKHFVAYRSNGQRFYLMKEGVINLDINIKETAKLYDKQYWQKKAKQPKKSVQSAGQNGNEANQT